jgi:GTPase SAR1 family protein
MLMRYTTNKFITDHHVTIGVEFGSKSLDLENEGPVKLQIWDTAGQEKFRSLVRSFYRGAHGIFLVYSVCEYFTFLGPL